MKIDALQLLGSEPILIEGIGHIVSPTLRKIKETGKKSYNFMLNILLLPVQNILTEESVKYFAEFGKTDINIFDVMYFDKDFACLMLKSLSFFIVEKIIYHPDQYCISVLNDENKIIGLIDSANFLALKNAILQVNYLKFEDEHPLKFRSEKSKKIYEKIIKNRTNKNKSNENALPPIDIIISSVAAKHNSYNLLNIWDLTIYQLYDQFSRINVNNQIDTMTQRWAYYGKEPFDFSLWYQK